MILNIWKMHEIHDFEKSKVFHRLKKWKKREKKSNLQQDSEGTLPPPMEFELQKKYKKAFFFVFFYFF